MCVSCELREVWRIQDFFLTQAPKGRNWKAKRRKKKAMQLIRVQEELILEGEQIRHTCTFFSFSVQKYPYKLPPKDEGWCLRTTEFLKQENGSSFVRRGFGQGARQ